jgi:DNA-binding MarR family transcriptional regulator/GNAT superfamily N-acetyltransferase
MASATKQSTHDDRVAAVRAFNRFYPLQVGLLSPGYLNSPFSITEARVIHEIATRGESEVADLRRELGLDAGYLSRMLNRLQQDGLIGRERSSADRRRQLVTLTAKGRRTFAGLDRRSSAEIGEVLRPHSEEEQRRLVEAMGSIRRILGEPLDKRLVRIREAEPGDHGWILERHTHVFERGSGWGDPFVALVAGIVADHLREHDPARERCWIAELDGERAGSIYCVHRSDDVAQLRLLFVEDWARGLGIGRKLVDRCIRFARSVGYERMVLWTNSSLDSARRIYDAAGFEQTSEAPDEVFPKGTVGQELWLDLTRGSG